MAAYFLGYVLPEPLKTWLLPGILAAGGVYVLIGIFRSKVPALARAAVGAGGALLLVGAVHFAPNPKPREASLAFSPYDESRVVAAGQPALIDFSAEWCAPCHELDDITFADSRVKQALNGRALFKADMTRQDSSIALRLASKFQILGMPTIVFLDASGKEIPDSRLVGFEPPEEFLKRLARIRSTELHSGTES
jgi:thiol:disulfide interchange protein DsbD